ncbi:thermonuclease family protein [Ostreiculturibacter nitratireducens]|uniref:thermonuclease family protein n=1 Tax=Ostreiculturibacter nitratireducens TaxID=3075226 RepID=UPI0031B5D31E
MVRRRNSVVRFGRDYRRPQRRNLGLPPMRSRRRIADPAARLRLVIVAAAAGLVALPSLADAVRGIARPSVDDADNCRVVQVIDGDTVSLWCPTRGAERARLTGFDTPELFSPSCPSELWRAWQAKWQLRWALWTADEVRTVRTGTDRYGRALVGLYVDGRDVRQTMIDGGNARAYGGGRRSSWCA